MDSKESKLIFNESNGFISLKEAKQILKLHSNNTNF